MIDIRELRDNPEAVRTSQRTRGEDPSVVDQVLEVESRSRSKQAEFEALRAEQKTFGKTIAQAPPEQKAELAAQGKEMSARVKSLEAESAELAEEAQRLLRSIGNIVKRQVPAGGEDNFEVLEEIGTPRDFAAEGFEPKDHVELGELLGAIDMERGAKVSGARFYFLTGIGARLEIAMMNMALDLALKHGFTPMITPTLVNADVMAGAGFIDAHEDEVYRLKDDDQYLTGTSEVALAGYHADEILDLSAGARRYAGWSTCYRREAGSHGKDTRGIIRVHQFNKLEMFVYCSAEQAEAEHERLLALEKEMLGAMELPFRVIDVAAGDLGGPAARKFDCEAWVPTQGKHRELTSTSNCTTFQARRLRTRERVGEGKGTQVVATLNGTLATTRWLVAILENHQQADGSVRVPEALRPYLGGLELIEPVAR